jgi:hypothetical protein
MKKTTMRRRRRRRRRLRCCCNQDRGREGREVQQGIHRCWAAVGHSIRA